MDKNASEVSASRKRAPNFTPWENQVLKFLIKGLKDTLDNKKTDHASVVVKQRAWQELTKEFNDRVGGNPYRSVKVLKHRYENIRKKLNKNMKEKHQNRHCDEQDSWDAGFEMNENDEDGTTENIHIEVEMMEEEEEGEGEGDDDSKDELRKILDRDSPAIKTTCENGNSAAAPFDLSPKPTSTGSTLTSEPTLEELKRKLLMEEHDLRMVQMKRKHKLEMELMREEHADRVSRSRQEHEAKMKFLEMQRKATLLNNL